MSGKLRTLNKDEDDGLELLFWLVALAGWHSLLGMADLVLLFFQFLIYFKNFLLFH